jgi:hypothetical protein
VLGRDLVELGAELLGRGLGAVCRGASCARSASMSASSAPNQPVGKMSEIMIAWSSETSSGSRTMPVCANGMRASSACSPSNGPVGSGPPMKAVPACGPLGLARSHCA